MTEDEPEPDFVDSGPFCRHWFDPSDCDERCARCGHTCAEHDRINDYCILEDCECDSFVDVD